MTKKKVGESNPLKSGDHDSYIPEPPKKEKYVLELTADQIDVIAEATEILARIGIGQFWTILDHISGGVFDDDKLDYDHRRSYDKLSHALYKDQNIPIGGGPGIHNEKVHHRHRIAWDIHQVLRHRRSWDRHPEGGLGVSFDTPYQDSPEPLPKIVRGELKYTLVK